MCEFYWENVQKQHFNLELVDKRVGSIEFTDDKALVDGEEFDFVVDCVVDCGIKMHIPLLSSIQLIQN